MNININHLSKSYDKKNLAIDNLTIKFVPGITGLVGVNGAGKSTLFRLISNVLDLDEGEISINGFAQNSKEAKELVYFLSDDPYYPSGAKAKDLVDFYGAFYSFDKEKYYELVNKFSLPLDKKISSFSKGMRRQIFICVAFSLDVKILLLDEAFDGLDPLVLEMIKEEIIKNSDGEKIIIISSHNISALEKLVDRFVIIYQGHITSQGTSESLGEDFVKYQAMFTSDITEERLKEYGLKIISYKKVGSILNFVIRDDEEKIKVLQEKEKPILLEQIPIDADEILTLQLMLSKKGGEE